MYIDFMKWGDILLDVDIAVKNKGLNGACVRNLIPPLRTWRLRHFVVVMESMRNTRVPGKRDVPLSRANVT